MSMAFMKAIRSEDQILIYGAGHFGDLLYSYLCMCNSGAKIRAFAVSSLAGQASEKHGLPLIGIDEAGRLYPDVAVLIAVHESSQEEMAMAAKEAGFDRILRVPTEELRNAFYEELQRLPIQKNKIFFMNYDGCGYGCNPKYIAKELISRGEDTDLVWGVADTSFSFPKEIRTVSIGTYDYYRELATAGIWVDNVRKGLDVRKRKGQYYMQTWHGAAPFKKVENDLQGKARQIVMDAAIEDSRQTDLFLSGSSFYSKLYRTAFLYEGEILEAGLPRMDVFWQRESAKSKVSSFFEISDDTLILLYAPTFRDDGSHDAYDLSFDEVRMAVTERFGKDCTVLVSRHPLNRNTPYHLSGEYMDAGAYDDFEELLAASDLLITDYSGCIYDFSFSGNPAFLYQPDVSKMKSQRDFYVQPEQMPYPLAHDQKALLYHIRSFDEARYQSRLTRFMSAFGNFDDGSAAKKVCDRILAVLHETDDMTMEASDDGFK